MKILLPFIVPVMILLSGCSPIKFSRASGLESESLSPRQAPAAVTKESDDSLKKKGYVQIGSISAKESIWTCWKNDCVKRECTNTAQKDLTKDIIEKAPAYGGDLLVIQENNHAATSMVEKPGECLRGYNNDYYVEQCSGGYGSIPRYCSTVKRSQFVCQSWLMKTGWECSVGSRGTVWRHDPEMIKRLAELERENKKRAAEAGKEREKQEAIVAAKEREFNAKKESYLAVKKKYDAEMTRRLSSSNEDGWYSAKIDGKYCYKNKAGKIVIEPQFTDTMFGFSEGLAAVSVGQKDEKKWGFIDKAGKWAIRPVYKFVGNFSEGLAAARLDEKYGYINKANQFVIEPQFKMGNDFHDGIAAVYTGKKWGFIDKTGKLIIEPQFDMACVFAEGLSCVDVDNKHGYIDKQGRVVIKIQYDDAYLFVNGVAQIQIGKKYGFINTAGEVLVMEP